MLITRKQLTVTYHGSTFRLPKGTELIKLQNGQGFDCFAVQSEQLLISLTGNDHDPKYRYCWIPARFVIEATSRERFKRWASACRNWVHWSQHNTAARPVGEFPYLINGNRAQAVYWGIGWNRSQTLPPRMQLDRAQDRSLSSVPRVEFDQYICGPKPSGREYRRLEILSFKRHRPELKNNRTFSEIMESNRKFHEDSRELTSITRK